MPRRPDWLILLTLWLMVFAVSSQFLVIAPILPRIAEQLEVGVSRLSGLVAGYALAVGLVAVVMGPVSDRLGRKRMLLMGTGAMSVALALHGVAVGYGSLLAARVLAGAGGGVLTGAAAAYVGDYFPYERRGWANGWVLSGMAAGQILGVPIGAVLAARLGFRAPFLFFAVAMAAAAVLVWRVLPQPPLRGSEDPVTLRGLPRHYARLLARPAVAAATAVYFASNLASVLYTLYLPAWLEGERGATGSQVALVFAAGGVATVLVGPGAGRLSDRLGRRRMVVGACLGGALLMAATPWLVGGVTSAYAVFFLLMALVAARAGPLDALLSEVVPASQRGSLMSMLMATGQLGFGLGSGIAGAVLRQRGYPADAALAGLALLLAGGVVARFLPEPHPRTVPALDPAAT